VGRASTRALGLSISSGEGDTPKSRGGQGRVFDTGGTHLKNSSGMATMKKDMGARACVLGLAQMIMAPTSGRLRVMVPAVENSVRVRLSSGDVLNTAKRILSRSAIRTPSRRCWPMRCEADNGKPRADALPCDSHGLPRAPRRMELPLLHR